MGVAKIVVSKRSVVIDEISKATGQSRCKLRKLLKHVQLDHLFEAARMSREGRLELMEQFLADSPPGVLGEVWGDQSIVELAGIDEELINSDFDAGLSSMSRSAHFTDHPFAVQWA